MPIRQGNHEPIKQDCLMSLSKANLLTLWGFCTLDIGLLGTLIAVNVPVISGFRIPVVLVLSAIALAGLTAVVIRRMAIVGGGGTRSAQLGVQSPVASR